MNQVPPQPPPPYYQDDEITLKELILKMREFGRELWRNKVLLAAISLLCIGGFLAKAIFSKTTYTAGLSFLVADTEESANPLSPYGTLDFIRVENNKITELARSGRIIHKVLLTKVVLDNKFDYVANHLIDIYGFNEKWKKEPLVDNYSHLHLEDFYFTQDSIPAFTPKEYRALNELHELVSGNNIVNEKGIMSISYNDVTDIFKLEVKVLQESLSLQLLETIFRELTKFYIEETVGRPKKTYELLTIQTDSLYQALINAESRLARATDRDRALTSSIYGLTRGNLQRDMTIVEAEYNASLKRQKDLELLLSQETPQFAVIDRTFLPVIDRPSKLKAIVIGGFLGFFLGAIYVIGRKIVRDAMNS